MPFPIRIRTDLSLNDLRRLHEEGASVLKTPHVGNVYQNNLGVASMGIPMVFYDRTLGRKDRNFHPHGVLRGGTFEQICDDQVLMTHAQVQAPSRLAPEWFLPGMSVAAGHMKALNQAIPEANTCSYSDFLRRHAGRVRDLLRVITETFPDVWDRYVNEDGEIEPYRCTHGWTEIRHREIYAVTSDRCGVLVPNLVNIILLSVIEAVVGQVSKTYHLSGPDMVVYIKKLRPKLDTLYDHMRLALPHWRLPETLPMELVPVANMRLVVPKGRERYLDALVDALLALQYNKKGYGQRIKSASTPDDRYRIIGEVNAAKTRDKERIRVAASECPEVFYDIRNRRHVCTQYDVIDQGGLYVHPWGQEATMQEIEAGMKQLKRLVA